MANDFFLSLNYLNPDTDAVHYYFFRLLEDLCSCESEGCSEFVKENLEEIKSLLLKNVSKAAITSRGVSYPSND